MLECSFVRIVSCIAVRPRIMLVENRGHCPHGWTRGLLGCYWPHAQDDLHTGLRRSWKDVRCRVTFIWWIGSDDTGSKSRKICLVIRGRLTRAVWRIVRLWDIKARAKIHSPDFLEPSANPSVPRADTVVVAMLRAIETRMEKCMSQGSLE